MPEFAPERVAALDPLSADDACARLPEMNARRDVDAIARTLAALLPDEPTLSGFSPEECLAATRDLGMFLGSIQRHGAEPIALVPGLEPVLIELGRRTDMVPRDTVHHYAHMNPSGARERTYTGAPAEADAIEIVRIGLRCCDTALGHAERLSRADPHDAEFALLLNDLADELGAFDTAISLAHDKIDPTWFYGEYLPYTLEITVGGERYYGPTAAHIPLTVIDTLVWESDHASADLDDHRNWALPYTMPRWRELCSRWATGTSLITRVSLAIAEPPATGAAAAAVRDAAAAMTAVLRALIVFRGKHIAYARKGSNPDMVVLLRNILDHTRQMVDLVRLPAPT